MSLKRSASHRLRALAARSPLKLSLTPRSKALIAALTLVLVWIVGPRMSAQHRVAEDDLLVSIEPALEELSTLPFLGARPPHKDKPGEAGEAGEADDLRTPPDQTLSPADAERFCLHHHLEPHNASAALAPPPQARPVAPAQTQRERRIYDLLVITPTTSADMLQLRLASMYQYVDYVVMLEAPAVSTPREDPLSPAGPSPLRGAPTDASEDGPSVLDSIWASHLSTYEPKIIRHTLSQHSHDFKTGLDHAATTRNALYTRVIPLLTGKQKVQLGDVLIISDVEEIVRPVAMKVLRNCHVPERTTIRTRKYWYGYQWMKIDGRGVTPGVDAAAGEEPGSGPEGDGIIKKLAGILKRKKASGNEWWPHPQATVYQGADTILPDELRRRRELDQYVFGDGGWTCHLCYPTITEMLARIGEMGVIWYNGPRWKGAGRVVDRVTNGIDVFDRTNLSRVDANADLPARLQTSPRRYAWMLDRDGPGAGFSDFDAADHERYLSKKKDVDAEPDFETTRPELEFNLANTQNEAFSAPPPPTSWRSGEAEDGDRFEKGETGLSEENRKLLDEIRDKIAGLGPEDLKVLDGLSALAT